MILRMAAVLVPFAALALLLPDSAEAQDPPTVVQAVGAQAADSIHVVQPGETLAGIARSRLGSATEWSRLFEANRDVISDPDRITVGMRLTIPPRGTRGAGVTVSAGGADAVEVIRGRGIEEVLAVVTGVELRGQVDPADAPPPEVVTPSDRRDLLRTRRFTPLPAPDYQGERTVFYGIGDESAASPTSPGVVLAAREEVLAVPRSAFHAAAWLEGEGDRTRPLGRIGRLAGGVGELSRRTALQSFDEVYLELGTGHGLEGGERLLSFRETRKIGDERVMTPTGMLEIREVSDGQALAVILTPFAELLVGHSVMRMRTFPLSPGVHPSAATTTLSGKVLGFHDRKEVYLPGDQAFIDLGAADGLAVGDELTGQVDGPEGSARREVARFQVIGVGERTATVRLVTSDAPMAVRSGLPVVVDRKMP